MLRYSAMKKTDHPLLLCRVLCLSATLALLCVLVGCHSRANKAQSSEPSSEKPNAQEHEPESTVKLSKGSGGANPVCDGIQWLWRNPRSVPEPG
jgi:hypothetical protein